MMDKKRWIALIIGIIVTAACLIVIITLCVHFLSTTVVSFLSVIPPPPGGNFFWFKTEILDDKKQWQERYDKYLDPYISSQRSKSLMNCPLGEPPHPNSTGVCEIDVFRWYPCVKQSNYNIHATQKCIFLQINQEADWIPAYYNTSDSLPENMPNDLRTYLKDRFNRNSEQRNNVLWLNCEGETPTDKELIGPVHYISLRGFGGQYFPNLNKNEYFQPLVAINFENPAQGIVINIACTVWAKNVNHEEEEGVVHFELFLDYAFSSSTLPKGNWRLYVLFTICLLLPGMKKL